MAECDYPESDAHKQEHKAFTEVATAMLERFGDDGYILGENTEENSLHLSMEINKTVVGWLQKHIMGSDKKLATFYRDWSNK
jgi:hemerythrin